MRTGPSPAPASAAAHAEPAGLETRAMVAQAVAAGRIDAVAVEDLGGADRIAASGAARALVEALALIRSDSGGDVTTADLGAILARCSHEPLESVGPRGTSVVVGWLAVHGVVFVHALPTYSTALELHRLVLSGGGSEDDFRAAGWLMIELMEAELPYSPADCCALQRAGAGGEAVALCAAGLTPQQILAAAGGEVEVAVADGWL